LRISDTTATLVVFALRYKRCEWAPGVVCRRSWYLDRRERSREGRSDDGGRNKGLRVACPEAPRRVPFYDTIVAFEVLSKIYLLVQKDKRSIDLLAR